MATRVQHTIRQLEKYDVDYVLKNESTGLFHIRRKSDGKLFQFYAKTGKISGFENMRGFQCLIKILNLKEVHSDNSY